MKKENRFNYLAMCAIATIISFFVAREAYSLLVHNIQNRETLTIVLFSVSVPCSLVALGFGIASLVQTKNFCKVSAILMGICLVSEFVYSCYSGYLAGIFTLLIEICAVVLYAFAAKGEINSTKPLNNQENDIDMAIKGLQEANEMLQAMIITQEEYDEKKAEYMNIINKI